VRSRLRLFAVVGLLATAVDLTVAEGMRILETVIDVVSDWPSFARDAEVDPTGAAHVHENLRLALPSN